MALAEVAPMKRPPGEWPYRFEVIPLDRLTVDAGYQRPLTTFVNEVRDKWNPMLVGVLFVNERQSGELVVVDGQTRWRAALERDDVDDIPCLVYYGMTPQEEADLMALLGRKRRQIRTYEQFRAELFSGKNPEAKDIARIAKRHADLDLRAEKTFSEAPPITAFQAAYRQGVLREVLDVVTGAWDIGGVEGALSNQMLRGLTRVIVTQERLDLERLTDRLGRSDPIVLRSRAMALQGPRPGSAAKWMAEAILQEYTRKVRS